MATCTENYDLTMPEKSDFYNVENFNENFKTIDTLMAESESSIHEVNEKIGSPSDTERTSLFGCLNSSGNSVIKSIQRVTYSPLTSQTSQDITINTVDPTKCFVIFERLYDHNDFITKIDYMLHDTYLAVTNNSTTVHSLYVAFWIIEFC